MNNLQRTLTLNKENDNAKKVQKLKFIKGYKKKKNDDGSYILTKRSGAEKILFLIVLVLFAAYALSLVLPFIWLLISSLEEATTYTINLADKKPFTLPKKLLFSNYSFALSKMIFKNTSLTGMFFNSLWYVFIASGLSIFTTVCTGYVFAKYNFRIKPLMYGIVIFCLTVPIVGTTGAMFRLVGNLGLYDSPLLIVVTSISGFGGHFLIMYAIFKNIPWSYAEAVFVDGGGQFTAFFRIMLPQAMPAVVTLLITSGIAQWNDYMSVLMYLPSYPTVSSGLYMISTSLVRYGGPTPYFAGLILSIIPILIIFILCSEMMMKNLSVGGIKG